MGTSFLMPILNDICLIIAGNIYNKNVLTNGARVDGIMSYKGTLTDNQYEGIKNTWQSFFSGVKNAGKTLFLNTFDGDIEYNSLSKSNKDMDFINLISMAQISIYKRFKIPLPMVETSKQTYSNYSEAQAQLYDNAVLPILDDILLQLRQLLSNKSIKINIDSLPLSTKIKYYDNMVRQSETKVLTPNEIRATLNLKPLKGGDILRDTATTPIAYDGNYSDISLYDIPTKKE
jgi:HK97 family phage portal protein